VCRVLKLAASVHKQTRPRSVLRPALLMACDNVQSDYTTSLGFYSGLYYAPCVFVTSSLRLID